MPQLMPLPWVISLFMIFFFIFLMVMMYSNCFLKMNIPVKLKSKIFILWLW
uniref:ATP synthase F0 subunit 8 n=1 Tax=Leucauge celebesiana TaxID=1112430 RepID=A0A6B9REB0_9ARAC|nr:ATP synthase F0 subunit 8 [Leucauge celebesiana]